MIVALAACASPRGVTPANVTPQAVLPSHGLAVQPDHGASSLPGGWLPCGYPTQNGDSQGDTAHAVTQREASCSIAISTGRQAVLDAMVSQAAVIPGLHPQQIDGAYNFPSNAAGMTVAIVDAFDDPRAETDLAVYRSRFNLPACTSANGCFTKVNQEGKAGPYPRANGAWSREIALDVDMVSAVCPRCPILLVEANSASIDDLGASVDEAVALGAKSVSNSYYAVEWPGETSEDAHYRHPGVAITVSSGDVRMSNDDGSGDGNGGNGNGGNARNRRAEPYYPASSPFVTAVGGTSLDMDGTSTIERAWGNAADGCSRYEAHPMFQPGLCATRSSVDLAVVGDPHTGVSVYVSQSGGWVVAGGTSVGAAIVAAAYALSGRPAGPGFSYAHRGQFNPLGPAGIDLSTGLGSPNGVAGL